MTLLEFYSNLTLKAQKVIEKLPAPDYITINDRIFAVPKDLQQIKLSQKIHLENCKFDSDFEAVKKILSVWYFPTYFDCIFDIAKCIDFETYILQIESYEAIPVALHFFRELAALQEQERKFLTVKRDPKQAQAGIDRLDKYGSFGIVDMLAGGDILKYKDIYQLTWAESFIKLRYEKDRSDYEKDYRDILNKAK